MVILKPDEHQLAKVTEGTHVVYRNEVKLFLLWLAQRMVRSILGAGAIDELLVQYENDPAVRVQRTHCSLTVGVASHWHS